MDSKNIGLTIALALFFGGGATGQIPEQTTFQPATYGSGGAPNGMMAAPWQMQYRMQPYQPMTPRPQTAQNADPAAAEETDADASENANAENDAEKKEAGFGEKWQEKFPAAAAMQPGGNGMVPAVQLPVAVSPIPYLAYHTTIDGRTRIVPYAPAYLFAPDQLPRRQSHWNLFWSSHPSKRQDQPQVQYLGYYDKMPTILESEPQWWKRTLGYPGPSWGPVPAASWMGGLPAAGLAKVTEHFYQGNWYEDCVAYQQEQMRRHHHQHHHKHHQKQVTEKVIETEESDVIVPTPAVALPKRQIPMPAIPNPNNAKSLLEEDPFK